MANTRFFSKAVTLFIMIFMLFFGSLFAQGFKFVSMSDSRGKYSGVNDPILKKLINNIITTQKDVRFIVFAGDLVDGSDYHPQKTYKELLHWKKVMQPIYDDPNMVYPKIWVTVGNHEIRTPEDEGNFKKAFPYLPKNGPKDEVGLTYSFDFMNTHFVMVDTDRWDYGKKDADKTGRRDWHYIKHLKWLKNDFASARKRGIDKIFVVGHEMPFPTGGHLSDGLPYLTNHFTLPLDSTRLWYLHQRDKFWDLLKEYHVTAYICGHEHLYSRESVDGVYQILTGSSGAPNYRHNPTYKDKGKQKKIGQEFTYEKALPYYKILGYNYGPGGNGQKSKDFFGLRAYHYAVFNVQKDSVVVKVYGMLIKNNSMNTAKGKIKLLDKFIIR